MINSIHQIIDYGKVKLESERSGNCGAVFTGFAVFEIDGKIYRRKLSDKKLFNEYRYIVRYKNKLYYLPYNIGSVLKGEKLCSIV